MTYREKLIAEHPELRSRRLLDIGCPKDYGYEPAHSCAVYDGKGVDCKDCWNRETPGEMPKFEHQGKPIAKVKDIYEENGGITAVIEPTIKDSGVRTEFATGAVRDIQKGKGRCDLMPLGVVAELLQTATTDSDPYIRRIKAFMDSGETRWLKVCLMEFGTLSPAFKTIPTMLLEVAKHFEEGAEKYGENNWQKGLPAQCYINSAVRHYLKWLRGDKDEPHDRAFVWNLMCCIWEVDYSPRAKGAEMKSADFLEKHLNIPEENPDKWVRLEDCPTGLFEFSGKVYLKAGSTVVHVNTGTVEPLHPDILVWPITIEEEADA